LSLLPKPPSPKPAMPPPVPVADPTDSYVARVLEIIPDAQPEHVLSLVHKHIQSYGEQTVERILHIFFEDPTYPKVDKKGKRKRVEDEMGHEERGKSKLKVDYGSKDREYKGGPFYTDIALVTAAYLCLNYIPNCSPRNNYLSTFLTYPNPISAICFFCMVAFTPLRTSSLPRNRQREICLMC
jgi:TRIAD3 protein (E3 ubiquitin-protein ligase RNF216)